MVACLTLLLVSLVITVRASNDWSQPCLSGECSYDLPTSTNSSSGTLKIWGSKNAISDITVAAGWEILGCASDLTAQDIRLVCTAEDSTAASCSHLYESPGAEGKIVRLPEACGTNAFARVAKAWVPEDQSIPSSLVRRIGRRDGQQPQVKALRLDTNFGAVDPHKAGVVNFALKGANVPGVDGDIDLSSVASQRRSRIYGSRGLFDFVGDAIDAISGLNDFDIEQSKTLSPLDVDKKFNLLNQQLSCPPVSASLNIDVDAKAHAVATIGVAASGTIIPPKVEDFAIISSLTADINGSVDMKATVAGSIDSGKIKIFEVGIPGLDFPGILTVGPTFEINAQAIASLDVDTDLTVGLNYHIDKAQLIFPPNGKKAQAAGGAFKVGDTPLKLSVSPSVKATGTVEAHLIPSLNLKLSTLGDLVNAGIFVELDASADMKLSLEAQAQGSLTIDKANKTADVPHVMGRYWATGVGARSNMIPSQEMHSQMQPSMLSTVEKPSIHMQTANESAGNKNATAMASTSTLARPNTSTMTQMHAMTTSAKHMEHNGHNSATSTTTQSLSTVKSTSIVSSVKSVKDLGTASASANSPEATKASGGIVATKDANGSFGGCFEIDAGLDVNAGADADFFGLFNTGTKVNLFSKKFQIFKKCFGNNARRSFPRFMRTPFPKKLSRRALVCPATDIGAVALVADEVVPAQTIKTL